jgi:hypothetical protein
MKVPVSPPPPKLSLTLQTLDPCIPDFEVNIYTRLSSLGDKSKKRRQVLEDLAPVWDNCPLEVETQGQLHAALSARVDLLPDVLLATPAA